MGWRDRRPAHTNRVAPCTVSCPNNTKIPQCLQLLRRGDLIGAWRLWVGDNPLPAVLGRICYAPCEENCNRSPYDEPVSVANLERFLGDYALEHSLQLPSPPERRNTKVACVGSGPAGLASAYHLARHGYAVTVFEALPVAGGMLRVGVPKFNLPTRVLQAEINRLLALGIEIKLDTPVTDLDLLFTEDYQAVLLAVGAHRGYKPAIPGADLPDALVGVEFLHHARSGRRIRVGKHVVVVGGGNVAIDVARTAFRFGAKQVDILCLERADTMPAHPRQIGAAEAEGIRIIDERAVAEILHEERHISGVRCQQVAALNMDPVGWFTWETRPGSDQVLPCDMVIFAAGQAPEVEFISRAGSVRQTPRGNIAVDTATLMTDRRGVFAAGDATPDCGTAARALAQGKRAAQCIDAFLRGELPAPNGKAPTVTYETLNPFYFSPTVRNSLTGRFAGEHQRNFREVYGTGYDVSTAKNEAARCFSCTQCFECDNCRTFCPDMAIKKLGPGNGYHFEDSYCKGCGICARECPCGSIQMVADAN